MHEHSSSTEYCSIEGNVLLWSGESSTRMYIVMYLIPDGDLKEGLVENEQFQAWMNGVVIVCLFP